MEIATVIPENIDDDDDDDCLFGFLFLDLLVSWVLVCDSASIVHFRCRFLDDEQDGDIVGVDPRYSNLAFDCESTVPYNEKL